MPYIIPSATMLKTRFPEFEEVGDTIVSNFISAAADEGVDPEQWMERDYQPAIIYLAAHFMKLYQNQLLAAQSGGTGGGGSEVTSYMSGLSWEDYKVTFATSGGQRTTSSSSISGSDGSPLYGQTMYGQLFIQLRRRNIFTPTIV